MQGKEPPCSDVAKGTAPFNSNVEAVEKPKKKSKTEVK